MSGPQISLILPADYFILKNERYEEIMDYTISVIIPTLNAQNNLTDCLVSLKTQNYPQDHLETIIVDGGSKDQTLDIARKFKAKIIFNHLKTSESGKALGMRTAKNELLLLIDSDNILESADWIRKMIRPFEDKEIIAAEPIYYTVRKEDCLITRYCALIGMNDPFCLFLGNYDRFSYVTGKWTQIPINILSQNGYIKFQAASDRFMTMGANGFMIRRNAVSEFIKKKYYFDVDVTKTLAVGKKLIFAKVNIGIIHAFACSIEQFRKKQRRRIKDYLYFKNQREYTDINFGSGTSDIHLQGMIKFSLSVISVLPLLYQSVVGFLRKPDTAWLFHPLACILTFWIYASEYLRYYIFKKPKMMQRERW